MPLINRGPFFTQSHRWFRAEIKGVNVASSALPDVDRFS